MQNKSRVLNDIEKALSSARIDAYRYPKDNPQIKMAVANHLWNTCLCKSLYPHFQFIEVALRNALYAALTEWAKTPYWFRESFLYEKEKTVIETTLASIRKKTRRDVPDHVVSELRFGFWTSLLDVRYEQVLWPTLLKTTFPYVPRKERTRDGLSGRFNKVRLLRNRVFHHERIWHWRDLSEQHYNMDKLISWLSPEFYELFSITDDFQNVYKNGRKDCLRKVESYLTKKDAV